MISFFNKKKYMKEYEKVERELYFKRLKLTALFVKVEADTERDVNHDSELDRLERDVKYLCARKVKLDKLIYGKKSKYL